MMSMMTPRAPLIISRSVYIRCHHDLHTDRYLHCSWKIIATLLSATIFDVSSVSYTVTLSQCKWPFLNDVFSLSLTYE